jgi:oligoendopeptidase F
MADPLENGSSLNTSGNITSQSLDISKVTAKWDLSTLYKNKDAAKAEFQRLNATIEQMNQTFRPKFVNLTGIVVLDYIESDKNFSKSLSVLYAYASAQNSLDVNDKFFETFLSDVHCFWPLPWVPIHPLVHSC